MVLRCGACTRCGAVGSRQSWSIPLRPLAALGRGGLVRSLTFFNGIPRFLAPGGLPKPGSLAAWQAWAGSWYFRKEGGELGVAFSWLAVEAMRQAMVLFDIHTTKQSNGDERMGGKSGQGTLSEDFAKKKNETVTLGGPRGPFYEYPFARWLSGSVGNEQQSAPPAPSLMDYSRLPGQALDPSIHAKRAKRQLEDGYTEFVYPMAGSASLHP